MNQANLQNEPTMDEILASIRKIISEDQPEAVETKAAAPEPVAEAESIAEPQPVAEPAAETPPPASAEPESQPEPESVVVVEETFSVSALAAEMAADEPSDLPPLVEESAADAESEPEDIFQDDTVISGDGSDIFAAEEAELPEEYIVETEAEEGLISDSARNAFAAALGQIDADDEPVRTEIAKGDTVESVFARAIQQAFEPTLQDWVDDNRDEIMRRLSPLIRDWMDDNLPQLIEAAVAKEIARAVRARRR